MRKYFIMLMIMIFLVMSCQGGSDKSKSTAEAKNQPTNSKEQKTAVSAATQAKRAELTTLLKDPKLGFTVYDPFTLPYKDFELEDMNGKMVKLSSFKGQLIFLNFWATWCGPCRAEMPAMERLYNALKSKGFIVIAVDLQDDKESVAQFISDNNLTFPVLLDKTGQVGSYYGARSIPTTYLFDRYGFGVFGTAGSREWDEAPYVEYFEFLLAER